MDGSYSILILPRRGTRIRRFILSKKLMFLFLSGGVALVGLCGWVLSDYLWVKFQVKRFNQIRAKAPNEQEQLSALQDLAENIQGLLADWRGLQKKVRASVPAKERSSANGHVALDELEKNLASLRTELERMISSVPTGWPAKGQVSSALGMRPNPWTGKAEFHTGLDIPKPLGTPVYAPGNGIVESAGSSNGNGKMVLLDHGEGITTLYAHLSKIHVKEGQQVSKGQLIANIGNTGKSTSPHLHYEVRVDGVPIDPRRNLIQESSPPS